MRKDLVTKISNTVAKNKDLEEADVRSLMILIRKLLDTIPETYPNPWPTIRLFCNWVAHIEITQSNTGLRILSAINNALVSVKDSDDPFVMQTKMSEAVGFPILRKEMKQFFGHIGVADMLVSDNIIWSVFITHLIEIIRDVPLSFPKLSTLNPTKRRIYEEIAQNPVKPGAGVTSIQISHINYGEFGAREWGNSLCLLIKLEDTTTIVMPLLIDLRI